MATGTMGDGKTREELLEAARFLNAKSPDQLSIAALRRKTGMSRSKVRRYFPTNAALKAAVKKKVSVKSESAAIKIPRRKRKPEGPKPEESTPEARPQTRIARHDWTERRFRLFERTLALLETSAEEAALEQSRALSSLAEKLSVLTTIPPIAAEPPPFVAAPAPREMKLAAPDMGFYEPLPAFQARKRLQGILENAGLPESRAAAEKPREPERAMTWTLISFAVISAVLLLSLGLFSSGDTAGAKQAPEAGMKRHAGMASTVLVIDATGMTTQSDGQQASTGTRDMLARAEGGDPHAQADAALAFLRGDGVDADPMAAIRWSQAAATQGDPNAQLILASLYADGVKPDPQRAFRWLSAAAARGNAKAMHNLAMAYLNGQGVEKDTAAAANWLVKAANGGYRDSAFDLAILYERGEGVARSSQDALKWYDDAASLGDSQAAERAKFLRAQLSQLAADIHR